MTKLRKGICERFKVMQGDRSLAEWSKATKVPIATLNRIVLGGMPSVETMAKVAKAEGVNLNWLFFGFDPKDMMVRKN